MGEGSSLRAAVAEIRRLRALVPAPVPWMQVTIHHEPVREAEFRACVKHLTHGAGAPSVARFMEILQEIEREAKA